MMDKLLMLLVLPLLLLLIQKLRLLQQQTTIYKSQDAFDILDSFLRYLFIYIKKVWTRVVAAKPKFPAFRPDTCVVRILH